MTDLREQLIVELDRARHGFGEVGTHALTLRSPVCGDEVTVAVDRDGDTIRSLTWRGHGCTVSMASASALAALLRDVPRTSFPHLLHDFTALVNDTQPSDDEALESASGLLGDAAAFAGIGRFPLRAGCATLAWRAVEQAIER